MFLCQGGQVHSITSASERDEPGARASRERSWRASTSQSSKWWLPLHPSILVFPETPTALCCWAPTWRLPLREKQPPVRPRRGLCSPPPPGKPQPRPGLWPREPLHTCLSSGTSSHRNLCFCCSISSQPSCPTRTHSPTFPLTSTLAVGCWQAC